MVGFLRRVASPFRGRHSEIAFAVLVITALAGPAHALDLLDVVAMAQVSDTELAMHQSESEVARQAAERARAQLLPNVSAYYSQSRYSTEETALDMPGQPSMDYDYTGRAWEIGLRQPLFDVPAYRGWNAGKARMDAAQLMEEEASYNAVQRVAHAYFDARLAAERLESTDRQIEYFEALLGQARRALDLGMGTRTDISDAEARLFETRAQRIEMEAELDVAERRLAESIGLPVEADDLLPLGDGPLPPLPWEEVALDSWLDRAEAGNRELASLNARVDASRQEVMVARGEHYPRVELTASRSMTGRDSETTRQSQYDTTSYGIQVSIPLFAGGGISAGVQEAVARLKRTQAELDGARRMLATRVGTEYGALHFGRERLIALERSLAAAQDALRGAEMGREAGLRDMIDLLDAQRRLYLAEVDLIHARHEFLLAGLRLLAVTGEIEETHLRQINGLLAP